MEEVAALECIVEENKRMGHGCRFNGNIHLVAAKENSLRLHWTRDTCVPASVFQTGQYFTV